MPGVLEKEWEVALDMPCVSEVLEGVSLVPCSVTGVHSLFHARLLVLLQPAVLATLEAAQPKLRPASWLEVALCCWPEATLRSFQILQVSLSKPTPLEDGAP